MFISLPFSLALVVFFFFSCFVLSLASYIPIFCFIFSFLYSPDLSQPLLIDILTYYSKHCVPSFKILKDQ